MKLKRILEETLYVEKLKEYRANKKPIIHLKSEKIHYSIDGKEVSEDIFMKEKERSCLKTKFDQDKIINDVVYNGPDCPKLVSEYRLIITQYVPLPFYSY